MRYFLLLLCAMAVALGVAVLPASFAEDDTKAPSAAQPATATEAEPPKSDAPKPEPAPDASPQSKSQIVICCDDGRDRATTTPDACSKRHGQILPKRFCEMEETICCRIGRGGEWMSDAAACARAGGEASDASYCKICCKQGRAEWWMPDAAACYRDGGVVANASYCR